MAKYTISGNTFPFKDQLRIMGCRWDSAAKSWYTEDAAVAARAQALLTPAPLYNSPPPADLGTTDPADLTAKFGRQVVAGAKVESRDVYGLPRGDDGAPNGTIHLIRRRKGEPCVRILQVARTARRYLSRDMLEDFDLFGCEAGGSYQWDGVEVVPTPEEAALDAAEIAKKAEEKRLRDEAAAKAKAEQEARLAVWGAAIAGLVETTAAPAGAADTAERLSMGDGNSAVKIALADGSFGWRQNVTMGDDWRTYYYLPSRMAASANLATAAERGITPEMAAEWLAKYKDCHGKEIYLAVAEATDEQKAELRAAAARKTAAEYERVVKDWRESIPRAVKPGDWKGSTGCEAWEALKAVGAEVEIVTDEVAFEAFCRAYHGSAIYSKERDALKLEIVLRAVLPNGAKNKNGSVKAAVEKKLPREWQTKTPNRYISVRVEYA